MTQTKTTAVTPTRAEDYAGWYQAVVRAADLAEPAPVRGCMTIKPWGYGIWERIQAILDRRFKETGHRNCYFPLFIPLQYLQAEAEHVEGFAAEVAMVTHHRLANVDGRLQVDAPLEEPLVVRPTSETIVGEAFSRWIQSHRDLPVLINQWANVVRWEKRPRIFLRTSEFLWQEGHTAHATEAEALEETERMLGIYREVAEQALALPVIAGRKTKREKFPGAVTTLCIEAMMQDGRALQSGTSHFLGQNFARAAGIRFTDADGVVRLPYTTSWGASTRLIGALIMTHGDDDGLRLPPAVAPDQVAILPVLRGTPEDTAVLARCDEIAGRLRRESWRGEAVRATIDRRPGSGSAKRWDWVRKGVPVIVELGVRDLAGDRVTTWRRDRLRHGKAETGLDEFVAALPGRLSEIQAALATEARGWRDARLRDAATLDEARALLGDGGAEGYRSGAGFVRLPWSGSEMEEAALAESGVTIRCLVEADRPAPCAATGAETTDRAILARAY
ncbi:proline--tRNA ligase [Mycobacterium sp. KBS0706]|uniref:aminoacyl--tRNA ligase-related protein n=1 Tax=Mycobacterium sp. KBS0706 TaxID=2578109 RepID=UPI00110FBB96|nr:aminoacyl--tRNA ligase-related protein [Mycobacterium sp. KBS0706]TSD89176.1 proline--tRNA ligase [Mycobacterium sp. KBS0706]